jgi:nucleoside-diphosphate-sugar epimerase
MLIERGHHVRVLDKLLFGNSSLKNLIDHERFQLMKGDIRHTEDVTVAMRDIEAVIDLAAIVGAPACENDQDTTLSVNYWATHLLAQVAISNNVKNFLFASTCSVYGANAGRELREDSDTNPLSLYAKTKLQSERALLSLESNLNTTILRMATLAGPSNRMRFDLVLNVMTASAFFNKEVRVHGGNQWRPLLDVRDAAMVFCEVLENSPENQNSILNVGSDKNNITISDLADKIAAEIEGTTVVHQPDLQDSRSYKVNFDRLKDSFSEPSISISQSITDVHTLFTDEVVTDYRQPIYSNSHLDYVSCFN